MSELAAKISERVRKYHPEGIDPCDCIEELTIFSHSGLGGQMDLGTDSLTHYDMQEYEDFLKWRKRLKNAREAGDSEAAKKARNFMKLKREGFQRIDRLKKISKFMCKDGKVDFVVCAAAAGDKGKKLKSHMEAIFGQGNVIMYEGDCKAHFRNHSETDTGQKKRNRKGNNPMPYE